MKIIDKINDKLKRKVPFYSFEFFPPKTEAGLNNLYARLDRMSELDPAFVDITWGAGGSTSELSLEISKVAQQFCGLDVMMHLTCTDMTSEKVEQILKRLMDSGVRNILALRGDPRHGELQWQPSDQRLRSAADLTNFIKDLHGDYFGIGVGGYPEGHAESPSIDADIAFLRAKVAAGADFVVTQLFYDVDAYFDFVSRCRKAGVHVPIIPGLMPIQTYSRFRKFVDACGIRVPQRIENELASRQADDAAVHEYGIELCADMCKELLERGAPGMHFYTLNLETSVVEVLKRLGFADSLRSSRTMPWKPAQQGRRENEQVRPIFWSNRPKSYLARTTTWDDFPNGRWGNNRSPTYGDLSEYYMLHEGVGLQDKRIKRLRSWGEPGAISDVQEVFLKYCRGEIEELPWSDGRLQAETIRIMEPLRNLISHGLLTINSQPQVNGEPSTNPDVGWGAPGGYVYQKAYVEFFMPSSYLEAFLVTAKNFPSISYQYVSAKGDLKSNLESETVNAVTWGIFPGSEVIQPTVVDSESFLIWKDEAFQLWLDKWASLYDSGSASHELIQRIYDTYLLVNVVENDFVKGAVFEFFSKFLDQAKAVSL